MICQIYAVPQGFIIGSVVFSINLCDLFLPECTSEFTNFEDDTTACGCGKNYDEVISKLEDTIEKLFNSFQFNNFKVNASNVIFSSHHINQL